MMVWDGHSWGWGGWFLMTISMVVFWALVAGVVVAVVRAGRRDADRRDAPARRRSGPSAPSAEDVLAERYARGEIDDEEFRRRLDVLRGRPGPTATGGRR